MKSFTEHEYKYLKDKHILIKNSGSPKKNFIPVIQYLIEEDYLAYLTVEEFDSLDDTVQELVKDIKNARDRSQEIPVFRDLGVRRMLEQIERE